MKKLLLCLPLIFGITACTENTRSFAIVDDAGYTHHTMNHMMDSRGTFDFPMHRPATGKKVFIFDPKASAWAAYDREGNRVKTGSASGGMDYCTDINRGCRTVTGTYSIYSKKGPECKSSRFPIETNGGAKMPYCMHFHKGYSIHAAYEVPNGPSSHGCIRVLPSAAKWLNENFVDIGTTVIVKPYH